MDTSYEANYTQFNVDDVVFVEEKDTSKKSWKRFLRVVSKINGEIVKDQSSPRGYAACRRCMKIYRLGPKGGTSGIEKHVCFNATTADDSAFRLAEKKLIKNQTEKDRKDEISGLLKDMSALVIGQENENLQELTRARLTRACLAEIPSTIIQFYTDGKSAKDRPLSFYDELQLQLNILSERFSEARDVAYHSASQQPPSITPVENYTMENATPPNLHLGLSYSKTDETIIEITWVSTDVESTLGFDRINLIGRKLSELVLSEHYAELVSILLPADGSTADKKDFSFPECYITEPLRHRLKTRQEYQMVFLTGYIRQCVRTHREKSGQQQKEMSVVPVNSSWPRLASFIHIYTYYQYMTLHSIDGKIIQADKRITMVAGYTCDEVINKSAHDFIHEDALPIVSQAQYNWLRDSGTNCISYPLKKKIEGTVYVKSRGEFVYYRDSATNQLVKGFILNNARICQEEYFNEMSNPQVQLDSSSVSLSLYENSLEACSSSSMAIEQIYNTEDQSFLCSTLMSDFHDISNYPSFYDTDSLF